MMKLDQQTFDVLKGLNQSLLDRHGREVNNPVPLAIPTGMKRPPSLKEQIQRVIRTDLAQQALDQGHESFEDANDFDVMDDFEMPEMPGNYELMENEYPVTTEPEAEPEPEPEPEPETVPDPEPEKKE